MTKHERAIEAAKSAYASHYHSGGMEAAIAAYHRVMREPGEGEVRVRVCVAVYDTDGWLGMGCDNDAGDEEMRWAVAPRGDAEAQYHWLEATVPAWCPPAEETVEGEMTP